MQHAERRWVEVGKPTNRRRLAGLLCSVIDDCDSSGLQFPPIFLERLRALRRGRLGRTRFLGTLDQLIGL